MGSYAHVYISDYEIMWTKNYLDSWYFKKTDRRIEPLDNSEIAKSLGYELLDDPSQEPGQCYFYVVNASTLVKRLEADGYTLEKVGLELNEDLDLRLSALRDWSDPDKYSNHFDVLQERNLSIWLSHLRDIVSQHLNKTSEFEEEVRYQDKFRDILLNLPDYQKYSEDNLWGYFVVNWPCISVEAFARAVLEVVEPTALCVLNATDLVDGGWTDAFADLAEFQAENTSVFFDVFQTGIDDARSILELAASNQVVARMLYANLITILESYLADTVRKRILSRPALLRRFVETQPDYQKDMISIAELFRYHDSIRQMAVAKLNSMAFHNLSKVIGLYKNVLGVSMPKPLLDPLFAAIEQRHHIVHRNGRTFDGTLTPVTQQDLERLMQNIEKLVKHIDAQVKDIILDSEEST